MGLSLQDPWLWRESALTLGTMSEEMDLGSQENEHLIQGISARQRLYFWGMVRDAVGLLSAVAPLGNGAEVLWSPIHWAFLANKEGFCASLNGQSLAACPFVIDSYRTAQFLGRNETCTSILISRNADFGGI